MTTLVMFFVIVCAALLQTLLPAWSAMGQTKVPLLQGLVVYYALTGSLRLTLQCAIVAGLLQDALGMIPLGYSSFCFCLVGLGARKFKDLVFTQQWMTHAFIGAACNVVITLSLFILLAKDRELYVQQHWIIMKTLGAILYGMVFVPVVFRFTASMDQLLGNTESHSI